MKSLLNLGEFSQFGLVGSGFQRKVDRLTLGVQTVCNHVHPELSNKYQDHIRERMHRVDPDKKTLHFDPSTELEVEIVVHSDGTVWNKANGVERLIKTVGETLEPPGRVLICGDTSSDLPMVEQAVKANPQVSYFISFFVFRRFYFVLSFLPKYLLFFRESCPFSLEPNPKLNNESEPSSKMS